MRLKWQALEPHPQICGAITGPDALPAALQAHAFPRSKIIVLFFPIVKYAELLTFPTYGSIT